MTFQLLSMCEPCEESGKALLIETKVYIDTVAKVAKPKNLQACNAIILKMLLEVSNIEQNHYINWAAI